MATPSNDAADAAPTSASGTNAIFRDPDPLEGDGSLLISVVDAVEGRCLELGGATEGWSRILDAHASEHVRHSTEATKATQWSDRRDFDTVVAACRSKPLGDVVSAANRALSRDGRLLLAVDGWTNNLRVDGRSPTGALADAPRGNAWYVRRTLQRAGFDDISLYGVFPSIADPMYVYPLSEDGVVEWFLDNRLNGWKNVAGRVANSAGIFAQGQPGYLAVCDRESGGYTPGPTLQRTSLNRVICFEFTDGEVTRLRKLPRPPVTDATIRNEDRVLAAAREEVGEGSTLGGTLPDGRTVSSPIGTVRLEQPATGSFVGDRIDADPAAVRSTLDPSLEWLASFQSAFRGDDLELDAATLRQRARCPPLDVTDPPTIGESVETFATACHGDFHPYNVFVDDEGITGVIDWEYASERGDPAIDVAHFLLYTCDDVGEDFDAGFERLCAAETPCSTAVRESLDDYCDRTGLDRNAIVAALPAAHVHTIRRLADLGEPPAYESLRQKYERRLATVTDRFDDVIETLGE